MVFCVELKIEISMKCYIDIWQTAAPDNGMLVHKKRYRHSLTQIVLKRKRYNKKIKQQL